MCVFVNVCLSEKICSCTVLPRICRFLLHISFHSIFWLCPIQRAPRKPHEKQNKCLAANTQGLAASVTMAFHTTGTDGQTTCGTWVRACIVVKWPNTCSNKKKQHLICEASYSSTKKHRTLTDNSTIPHVYIMSISFNYFK